MPAAPRMTEKTYGPREDPEPAPVATAVVSNRAKILWRYVSWGAGTVAVPSTLMVAYVTEGFSVDRMNAAMVNGDAILMVTVDVALVFTLIGALVGLVAGLLVWPWARPSRSPWLYAAPAICAPVAIVGGLYLYLWSHSLLGFSSTSVVVLLCVCAAGSYLMAVWHESRARRRRPPSMTSNTADPSSFALSGSDVHDESLWPRPSPVGRYMRWGALIAAVPALVITVVVCLTSGPLHGERPNEVNVGPAVFGLAVTAVVALGGALIGLIAWCATIPVAYRTALPLPRAVAAGSVIFAPGFLFLLFSWGRLSDPTLPLAALLFIGAITVLLSYWQESRALRQRRRAPEAG